MNLQIGSLSSRWTAPGLELVTVCRSPSSLSAEFGTDTRPALGGQGKNGGSQAETIRFATPWRGTRVIEVAFARTPLTTRAAKLPAAFVAELVVRSVPIFTCAPLTRVTARLDSALAAIADFASDTLTGVFTWTPLAVVTTSFGSTVSRWILFVRSVYI